MPTEQQLEHDDPRVVAFAKYKASEEYQNTKKWAREGKPEDTDGSLWAAFIAGWAAFIANESSDV